MNPSEKNVKRAEWIERLGLLVFGAFVVQQLVAGASAQFIIFGFIATVALYASANYLLTKA